MKKTLLSLTSFSMIFSVAIAHADYNSEATNAFLMDASTGYIMFEKEADTPMPPASMSKLMTAYIIFENLKAGKITLEDEFIVSENAWKKGGAKSGGSTMFLSPNEKVKVKDLLRGIIVQSGNDACIVAAENLAGTEEAFAALMTEKAQELGLQNSTFKNATGLPDPEHKMSAKDLAKLAQLLIKNFPEYYSIYSEKSFTYNGIKQGNRNPLLYTITGADGLKTGHTEESGYGLTGSVKTPEGRRLIMVINGLKSMHDRQNEAKNLMNWGLVGFENVVLIKKGQAIDKIPTWLGEQESVEAVAADSYTVTKPRGSKNTNDIKIVYDSPVSAPIQKGQKIGSLVIHSQAKEETIDLIAAESVKKVGYFGKMKRLILSWL